MARAPTCECGECLKCRRRLYMREYYRRPGKADLVRDRVKRYYEDHPDQRPYRARALEKRRAAKAVAHAVERGELEPQPCERCGTEKLRGRDGRRLIQAHHDDYSEPLEVRWLCAPCHGIEHRVIG